MTSRTFLCAVVLLLASASTFSASQHGRAPECRPTGPVAQMPELPEASGIAASRKTAGRLYSHNDSGQPVLFVLNDRGAVTGRVRLTGITVEDWEATAVASCPSGSCVYVGDIGDNSGKRDHITIFRLPEPDAAADHTAVAEAFHAKYPDGPHDAEAMIVTPKGDMFIVTKGNSGPVTVYQFPRDVRPGTTVELTRVGKPRDSGKADEHSRVTDAAISPNGAWIVLRTHRDLFVYPASEVTSGGWRNEGRVDLTKLGEPQGEGVTFGDDSTLFLVGEGGESRGGTFVRVSCTF